MANTVTELMMRRMGAKSGSAIDWETIARGMLDGVTPFDVPDGVGLGGISNWFLGRRNLKSIVIPLATVPDSYCYACSGLLSVNFGENVTRIGTNAFRDCSGIQEMVFNGTTPPTLVSTSGLSGSLGATTYTFPIYVPDSAVNDYKAAASWVNYASRVKGISERPT